MSVAPVAWSMAPTALEGLAPGLALGASLGVGGALDLPGELLGVAPLQAARPRAIPKVMTTLAEA